jgi:hypothetical protein
MTEMADTALLLEVLNELRKEAREHRALLFECIEQSRSLERHLDAHMLEINQRVSDLKDVLELTIKSELMGLAGDFGNGRSGAN